MGGFAEVLLEEHAAPRVVLVGGASAAAISRDAPDAAGGVSLRAVSRDDPSLGRRRLLTWTVASHDACALHLAETSLGGANAPPPRSARVVFPRPLVPLACVLEPASEAPDAATRVATLDVSGRVYLVHLRPPSPAAVHGARGDDDSFLSRLAPSDVYAHDASADLAALEGATAMAAVGVTKIAVGGNTGRVAILDAESLAPLAELKPAALARLWNAVAGVGPEQSAIRGLRMIPRPHRTAPVLLAALRADCHLQVWDLSGDAARGGPLRPTSVLAARLPGSPDAATIGGVDRSGGDGSGMRSREARAMHVADGFLAAAISGDSFESSLPAKDTEEDPRLPRRSSIFLYRLDCSGPAPPSVAFHAEVKGSEGRHAEVRVADGRVWSLDASGVGDSPAGLLATRARGWPLDRGALAYPCEDLGDVATELAEWTAPGAAEQAAALLLASHPGASARDVAADLASELRQRGVAGAEAAEAALRGAGIPHDSGAVARDPVGAVAAAIVRAAGGSGASAKSAVDAWSAVAGEYASSWAALRRPTGFADAGPKALALVRGTGAVSVMRPLEPVEAFVNASVAARETFVVGAADVRELAPTASPAATAVAAGAALDAALGAPARRAMDLVARGAGRGDAPEDEPGYRWTVSQSSEDWVDAAVAAAFGRASSVHLRGMSSSRALDDASREALRKRRARHRAAAGTLRAAVAKCGGGDATRVATCCAAALDALEWHRVPPASPSPRPGSFFWTDAAKSRAAAQQCRARARALRGIVLLLGATRRGGGRDLGASRDGADAAAALLPRAAAALRDALLAAWLASTPRTVGVSSLEGETRLGFSSASSLAAAARGWAPAPAALSGSASHLTAAASALAAEVVVGSDNAASSAYRGAYARFVEIGAELYAGGEVDALATLLNAARRVTPGDPEDPAPHAPALAFLEALRAAAGSRGEDNEDPESARALAAFHRAAAGASPGDGEQRGDGEQQGSDPLLRQLVRLLHGIMSGFPVEEEEEEEEDPEGAGGRSGGGGGSYRKSRGLTRLEYYETLTLFFERLGRPAAASECAFAALREVPEEDAGRSPSVDSSSDARAARLWANVLQYALALGRWGDAYAAVLSTPGDEARASALRRLTAAACEPGDPRGGAAALAALPLGDRFASVAAALEARAKAAPAEASPDPAMMLYAARVARGDARGAAAAALIRARTRERDAMRAAKEADAATGSKRELAATRFLTARLEAHCGALLVVVNALRLCAPGERSVALSDEDGEGFDDEKKETDAAGGKAAKRRRVPGRGRATLADLLREYALAATRLELLVAGADVASLGFAEERALPTATAADGGEASSEDARAAVVPGLVAACCAHGLFTAATTLATHWTEGEALTNLATVIAATLAARAALAQIAAGGSGARPTSLSLEPSSLEPGGGAGGYGGALASAGGLLGGDLGEVAGRGSDRGDSPDPSACWSALRSFLETHDSPARGHRLTEAAARCALAAAPALRLPQWLQARFTSGRGANGAAGMARRGANPAALLSAYLHHDRLEEAARLALAELGAATRAGGPAMPERAKHCAAWFPEPALHATRERLRGVEALAPLGDALEQALEEYRRRADADGDALAASA